MDTPDYKEVSVSESILSDNGLTISVTIKGARQPAVAVSQPAAAAVQVLPETVAEPVPTPFDYENLVTRLLEDARFVEELGKRLGMNNLAGRLLELHARVDSNGSNGSADEDGQDDRTPRIVGYVIPNEGTVHLFSANDIYGNVWGMDRRNYGPLMRADIDPEEALYMNDDELIGGNIRMFGAKALEDLKAKRRPLNYRGLHIPNERHYHEAARLLEHFRNADDTGLFSYDLAGNQTVIAPANAFRAVAQLMIRNGIACREFAVDVNYPNSAPEEP